MKVRFLVGMMALMICMVGFSSVEASNLSTSVLHPEYSWEMDSLEDKVNHFASINIVQVKSEVETLQYNGEGMPVPITNYRFKNLDSLKGNLNQNNITASYYGGTDEHGTNYLVGDNHYDNNELPNENSYYVLLIDNPENAKNGRIDKDQYVIYDSRMMIELPNYDVNKSIDQQTDQVTISRLNELMEILNPQEYSNDLFIQSLSAPCFEGPNGECVGVVGTSFANAYTIAMYDTTISKVIELSSNGNYYFKITAKNSFKISMFSEYYSTYNLDVEASFYDSSYHLIGSDDQSGSGDNFLDEYLMNDNDVIYVKVTSNELQTGSTRIKFDVDEDCFCVNDLDNLMLGRSSVVNNEIVYEDTGSDYIDVFEDAVDVWNALGLVNIREAEVGDTVLLEVGDFFDPGHPAWALWSDFFDPDVILYNDATIWDETIEQQTDTSIHELGHALGIAHMTIGFGNDDITQSEDDINIMTSQNPVTTDLGPCDKLIYYYIYE